MSTGHSSGPDPWSYSERATRQVSAPPGTPGQAAGEAAADAGGGEKWNRMHSTAGFFDRPHRSGNRAGSHLKTGGSVRFPLLPLSFKWETL